MMMHQLVLMFTLQTIALVYSQQCSRNNMFFISLSEKNLHTDPFNIISTVDLTSVGEECLGKCRALHNCKSFNVYWDDGKLKCSLLNVARCDKSTSLNDSGSAYYEMLPCDDEEKSVLRNVPAVKDCTDLLQRGFRKSGVYGVTINRKNVFLYCDMETHGGGWTVIVRRYNGETDFYRNWESYSNGFGDIRREFWLGNSVLNKLTEDGDSEVLFKLTKFNDEKEYFALYKTFQVSNETTKYTLEIADYKNGTFSNEAGDSMWYHNNQAFATFDRDNNNCVNKFRAAWWVLDCLKVSFLGKYSHDGTCETAKCIHWNPLVGNQISAKTATMMTRRKCH